MSDFFENETPKTENEPSEQPAVKDEFDGYDTIFGDPAEHRNKAPKSGNKKRLKAVIASVLAVAVLVGGTLAVIKLIPEKESGAPSESYEETTLFSYNCDDLDTVTVTNANGTFRFVPDKAAAQESSEDGATAVSWYLDGIEHGKVNSGLITEKVNSAAMLKVRREVTGMTDDDCGLKEPVCTVAVTSAKNGDYTVSYGTQTAMGVYAKVSGDDKIYLAESASAYQFELLDLASMDAFPGVTVPSELTGKYCDENGALMQFDRITVSGKNFKSPVVIEPNDIASLSDLILYKVSSPHVRLANHVEDVFGIFQNGFSVIGAYSMDVSAASLKAVGLDDPDITVSLKIGTLTKTYHFASVDGGNYAAIADDSDMIKKISAETLPFRDYNEESFYYNDMVFMNTIDSLSGFKMEIGDEVYDFSIAKAEDDDKNYAISCNGQKITATNFQDFYAEFVSVAAVDFTTQKVTAKPDMRVIMTMNDGGKKTIDFKKITESRYQYEIDGIEQGRIAATQYNAIVKKIRQVAANKK